MTFNLTYLFVAVVGYLSLLFLIAYATEHGKIPKRVVRHPLTYVLSLGVYATSWSYYGSVGFAETQGYTFLAVYLGVTVTFIMAPVLLQPILRLVREYQLTSPADLFAFRYRSQLAGIVVTLFMLAGTLPYIALQIRAVTESLTVLTQEAPPRVLAFVFCVTVILFAILFGARHISPREKHEGLVVAIAFESLVKLVALLIVGSFAVFGIFGGLGGMNAWLQQHPEAVQALYQPTREGPWLSIIFLAFAAAFLLPRQFHMTFTENINPRGLPVASWAFPLFLLLLNLAIPPILWAGHVIQSPVNADYFVLGITLGSGSDVLPIVAFLGGVSAASAMMIVTTVALSAMCLNHIILPASYPDPTVNLYRWLLWGRRLVIAAVVLAGYGFYVVLEHNEGLVQLGLISFVAVAQFVPGVVGVLYWARANQYGFLAGLTGGALVWLVTLIIPLLEQGGLLQTGFSLTPWLEYTNQDKWTFATFWSLAVNAFLFVVVSLVTKQKEEERESASVCTRETFTPRLGVLKAQSSQEFTQHLARVVGTDMAQKEVERALDDLGMRAEENNPAELRKLRDRIERNLSGLLGPEIARALVNEQLRIDHVAQNVFADTFRMVEERLEDSRTQLRGLAAELDALRRYHRQVLQDLPVGVCSVGPDNEIVIWNQAMVDISGLRAFEAMGRKVDSLTSPWGELLDQFIQGEAREAHKVHRLVQAKSRWFSLHKARLEDIPTVPSTTLLSQQTGVVVMVEDLTETHVLEAELMHSERLASIGRFAAGVAHEIGNPVTGIACLAQNIRDESEDKQTKSAVNQILEQTKRIGNIVRSLVGFSHGGQLDSEVAQFELDVCIEEAIDLVKLSERAKHINFDVRCAQVSLWGDRQRLLQVIVNVLTNACDASPPDSEVKVRVEENSDFVDIVIQDEGSGIEEAELNRVFDPFYTTKEPGIGTGLGLALSYNIVKEHGGHINISSTLEKGTTVRIRLKNGQSHLNSKMAANQ
ncbi:MAG: ATP-binding protein [Arenicellales bacterium]|nr:ATP-binding protein [Arenicellales bacterium]